MENTNKAETQNILVTEKAVKTTLFDYISRGMIMLISFFAYNIYNDVKTLVMQAPVTQEKIQNLENKVLRLENKIFTDERFTYPYSQPMKKEDEITLDKIKK